MDHEFRLHWLIWYFGEKVKSLPMFGLSKVRER